MGIVEEEELFFVWSRLELKISGDQEKEHLILYYRLWKYEFRMDGTDFMEIYSDFNFFQALTPDDSMLQSSNNSCFNNVWAA